MSVVGRWPVDAERNFPMALDEADNRLIVGCRVPAVALIYDTTSGKTVDRFPIAGDADDLYYDGKLRRLYVCGGEGLVSVHQQDKDGQVLRISQDSHRTGSSNRNFCAGPRSSLCNRASSRLAAIRVTGV